MRNRHSCGGRRCASGVQESRACLFTTLFPNRNPPGGDPSACRSLVLPIRSSCMAASFQLYHTGLGLLVKSFHGNTPDFHEFFHVKGVGFHGYFTRVSYDVDTRRNRRGARYLSGYRATTPRPMPKVFFGLRPVKLRRSIITNHQLPSGASWRRQSPPRVCSGFLSLSLILFPIP